MASTERAITDGQHPMVVAAKWHGYYEYLHPFRDGNGRTGRLLSNFLLLRAGHPLLIIRLEDQGAYISVLKKYVPTALTSTWWISSSRPPSAR